MARRNLMLKFARWHIWLGWLVGVPILMWCITGLVMTLYPIEEVRGEHLRAEAPLIDPRGLVFPADSLNEASAISLVQQVDGPAWLVTEADGGRYRYSARTGEVLPPLIESEARRVAEAAYAGGGKIKSVTYFPADLSPMDLRAPFDAWRAHFSDGTNIYMRSSTGEIVAVRTGWWRIYDFMWGLHIMDLETREDTSHPVLTIFAALAVIGALLGCVLMFRRRKAKPRFGGRA
ncbi:MAG: hypothetical protein B7Y88_04820 [Sphingomonadales bacterium 32-64-17]|nr:MAG: hypothetical protein B7Y88_04820 [Sphingomonadales bacterium 32-64-17]